MKFMICLPVLLLTLFNTFHVAAQSETNSENEEAKRNAALEATATLEAYKLNALGDKLISTPSGLKYVIHHNGSGLKVKPGQYVLLHYYGMLLDGMRFDDSYKNGYPFGFLTGHNQVIAGFDEALTLLPEGSRFTVFIPAKLAYGENGAPPVIPANAELVFHLNFIKIESQD